MTAYDSPEAIVDAIIEARGRDLTVALPLGLGKPNHIVNELYRRAKAGELDHLRIFTALSLIAPRPGSSGLERRLMEPVIERLYADYPGLTYAEDRRADALPDNVTVEEFYYPPGSLLGSSDAQQNYKSVNFTDAYREIVDAEVDVIAQLVAPGRKGWDLSCNPDISLELLPRCRASDVSPFLAAQVNRNLPYMGGSAEVSADTFHAVLDDEALDFPLFAMPSLPPSDPEYAIGARVASLIRDGGTLQIGIGSMGESVSWASILRHCDNEAFRRVIAALEPSPDEAELVSEIGGLGPFDDEGLYAATEMFVEGLMQMYDAGLLRRRVDTAAIHAAFYLGSARFYERLRNLTDDERDELDMTSVLFTNLLYGDEEKKRAARTHARFINQAMMFTLFGGAVSDGLEDGRVVSGVGGQFEFVTQARALHGARSILMSAATREKSGKVSSNIVFNYGHVTIPRHLRDIVVTEYGAADLRGRTDQEVATRLIEIADARFQDELLRRAVDAGKVASHYRIPDHARRNTPEWLADQLAPLRADSTIPRTPFGSVLTDIELDLVGALRQVAGIVDDTRSLKLPDLDAAGISAAIQPPAAAEAHLERMGLQYPDGVVETVLRALTVYGLKATGAI
jgi:hypothetical protein